MGVDTSPPPPRPATPVIRRCGAGRGGDRDSGTPGGNEVYRGTTGTRDRNGRGFQRCRQFSKLCWLAVERSISKYLRI